MRVDLNIMTELQAQVVAVGRCPECHTKSLRDLGVPRVDAETIGNWFQCQGCLKIWAMSSKGPGQPGPPA